MNSRQRIAIAAIIAASSVAFAQAPKRAINLDDLARFHDVHDAQCSPDGKWAAYSVSRIDQDADKRVLNLAMVDLDSRQTVHLTYSAEGENAPRWSPDGKYLSFVAERPGPTKGAQIWLLDRRGGEARQLTKFKDMEIGEYDWSPDAKKLLLVMHESEDAAPDAKPASSPDKPADATAASGKDKEKDKEKKPKPIVIDRYHFKQDIDGYLSATTKRDHIYIYDIASGKLDAITNGNFDDSNAKWSPDGTKIAFISNRDTDPDRSVNSDVWIIDAALNATAKRITSYTGPDVGPISWSADGKYIAYLQGDEGKYTAYNQNNIAIIPVDGGAARVLTTALDRNASDPHFAKDGKSIYFLVADDRSEYPARVSIDGGKVERLVDEPSTTTSFCEANGRLAAVVTNDTTPTEIFAIESHKLRKLTGENDDLMSQLRLASVEDIGFKDKDGVEVHGVLTKPLDYQAGAKYPLLLRIHGGPDGQDGHEFDYQRQFFAANGYAVVNINYRGSSGRGQQFQRSIFADWGNKEVADLLAGVDQVVKMGVADPARLGIGGWSYGGILTDYTIASDPRFKAAVSGASSANQISMYGVDEYVYQYDNELGPPWKNPMAWVNISYPFFKADRIHTPTLFMGGDKDFNVPLIGTEQMYQALRTLNVPTELVIYPGQFHGFTRPSFIRDRYTRYIAWYDRYLKPQMAPAQSKAGQ